MIKITLRNYNNNEKEIAKMQFSEKRKCDLSLSSGCNKKIPCELIDHICPYCGKNLGDGCPLGFFYERFLLSADGMIAICEFCDHKIQMNKTEKTKSQKSQIKIEFSLSFTPDIHLNDISIEIEVNSQLDTYYIVEHFQEKIQELIKVIKETEDELF